MEFSQVGYIFTYKIITDILTAKRVVGQGYLSTSSELFCPLQADAAFFVDKPDRVGLLGLGFEMFIEPLYNHMA